MRAVITDFDMLTPYGAGIECCWNGLISGRSAIDEVTRFDVSALNSHVGGQIPDIPNGDGSILWRILECLFERSCLQIPRDAALLLATTTGEVDLIERAVLAQDEDAAAGALPLLLEKVAERLQIAGARRIVSAACISSTAALAEAASMICAGECDCVCVIGCDALSEFVFAGFSSLMALDPSGSHPFDAERRGLSVGEAAACAVVMSEARARQESRPIQCEIAGWGLSNDANHMTGPSRDGSGLARAIELSLKSAAIEPDTVAAISAHGTGTRYNDNMEMLAFKQVFGSPRPIHSVKGGMGHSMGAAGLTEALLCMRSISENVIPGTVGLRQVDEAADGWASSSTQEFDGSVMLSTNAGFGGVNAALVLRAKGAIT